MGGYRRVGQARAAGGRRAQQHPYGNEQIIIRQSVEQTTSAQGSRQVITGIAGRQAGEVAGSKARGRRQRQAGQGGGKGAGRARQQAQAGRRGR